MGDFNQQIKSLLLPLEETFYEQLIRYGLYVGAFFQISCFLAVVVHQTKFLVRISILKDNHSDVECSENSPQVTPRKPHKPRKQEKKKRR